MISRMKIIEIKQKKQENGLWGTPFNCYKIDKLPPSDNRKCYLRSALIAAINQKYNKKFEAFNSTDDGFAIEIYDSAIPLCEGAPSSDLFSNWYMFPYENYEVVDDILYEFDNDQEHIAFLRKQKINSLEVSRKIKQI